MSPEIQEILQKMRAQEAERCGFQFEALDLATGVAMKLENTEQDSVQFGILLALIAIAHEIKETRCVITTTTNT